jgi:hypothetical protein
MAAGTRFDLFPSAPASTFATLDTIAGASTPAEVVPVIDYDASTVEYYDFYGNAQGYASGGLTLRFGWAAATATTGTVRWEAAIRRIVEDAEDLDTTAHTYDYNAVNVAAPPSAVGEVDYTEITFTDGADMDSLASGEDFILRLKRQADDATNDTMAGDASVLFAGMTLRETA